MAESNTFEKGECSRTGKEKMGESSLSSEKQEESTRTEIHQTPTSSAAAEIEERINPELLRAIVNGDLKGFKKILGIEDVAPNDIESIQESNGGNSGLRGVICGKNTVLHVVAGVMQKSSSRETSFFHELLYILLSPILFHLMIFFSTGLVISLIQTIFFVSPVKGIWKRIAPQFIHVSPPREHTSPFLKRVFLLLNDSVLRKKRMNQQIAEIICNQDPTWLNACNNAGETPLHCAAKAGRLEIVSFLVNFAREKVPGELEKMLRAKNEAGETALHEAARSGYSDVVEVLLSADEKLASLVDNNGISPLYWAVTAGRIDVVEMLISPNRLTSDADPKRFAGPDGQTVLHAAVMRQEEEILRKILNCERHLARPLAEEIDKAGNTPLHYAALIGNIYAVRELLLKDTGPVYKDNLSGSFPVHLAAEAGNFSVIKELLSKCPDVGVLLDREKRNFLHVA